MAQECPLIFRQVDATVTRINTFSVIAGIIVFLITHSLAVLFFLLIDFILRLYGYKQFSPVQNFSLWIKKRLSLPTKMEDAGAKRLAAFFGVGFVIALGAADILGLNVAVNLIAAIFLVCASLELLFGYCVACKIYYIAKKLYPKAFE
ncbi:DUF4395 domain-containing protein [uncultured Sulfuricurvum sp.]|uniref:DUF4395 domain-containing protein n=1 Tax=uncultured Sulfuricurvum sp. TaxID=430693 RepID=UPI0026094231|nr:DUF4395 domain-containing protein [uncultured Sulfuricurvum sp.]